MRAEDLTGQHFGRLIAIKRVGQTKGGNALWLCRCDCGNEKIVAGSNLKNGHTRSCGCLHSEIASVATTKRNTKHGLRHEHLYNTWAKMKARCYSRGCKDFVNYGGRGVVVCDEWCNDYVAFRDWALANGYCEDLTIDRIDVNGNYEPNNCRWATRAEQNNNKRNNRLIEFCGEVHNISEWAKIVGVKYDTLWMRINRGWPVERALTKGGV